MIGATFWARYFPVFALGPVLVSPRRRLRQPRRSSNGAPTSRPKDHQLWIFLGGFAMIALMTAILIAGTKTTFRWQNTFCVIAMTGTLVGIRRAPLRQQRGLPGALQRVQRPVRGRDGQRRHRRQGRDQPGRRRPRLDDPGDLRRHDVHDVELVVRLPLGRAQERDEPRPPAQHHVRCADLRRPVHRARRDPVLQGRRVRLRRRGEQRQRGLRDPDPAPSSSSSPAWSPTSPS